LKGCDQNISSIIKAIIFYLGKGMGQGGKEPEEEEILHLRGSEGKGKGKGVIWGGGMKKIPVTPF
jgi:hypothetical protein